MKATNSLFLLPAALLALVSTACGGSPKPDAPMTTADPVSLPADPVETAATTEADESTWEGFFPLFQAAVAMDDQIEVSYFVKIDEGISSEEYLMQFDMYFDAAMKKVIAESTAASWTPSESEDGVYEVTWSESVVDDAGDEYGSALILYFKSFDGKFRLFRWMAAG